MFYLSHYFTQIIETDPSDASFRFRITWSKNCSVRYNSSGGKTTNGSNSVASNGNVSNGGGGVKLLNTSCVTSTGCENERYS